MFQVILKGRPKEAEAIAEAGRQRLLAGEPLDAVKAWVVAQMQFGEELLAANDPP